MYLEKLKVYVSNNPYGEIAKPASAAEIEAAERHVGCSFPKELRDLLLELNGDGYLLFSTEKMTETYDLLTDAWQEIYPDIGQYLFFAENGCGDYYGCYFSDSGQADRGFYLWEHETGDRTLVANSITELIDRYYQGEI